MSYILIIKVMLLCNGESVTREHKFSAKEYDLAVTKYEDLLDKVETVDDKGCLITEVKAGHRKTDKERKKDEKTI